MESETAVRALAALAQSSRLALFRSLVQAGPMGDFPGELSQRLDIPTNTLSFHLKTLAQAGLVDARREGRAVRYVARFDAMNELVAFLGENCCGGDAGLCVPDATARGCNAA